MAREREKYINSINLNSQTDFPYLVLDVVNDRSYPRNPGFHVMHWHEDLQFGYVLEGAVVLETLDESWKVSEGEGFFINKNVIHTVRRLGNCHYKSFIFPTYFLGFYEGSPARDIVDSITENEEITCLSFANKEAWKTSVNENLAILADMEKEKTEYYAYEILLRLSSLWLTLRKNITLPEQRKESAVHLRMKEILQYIEEHYGEDITLENMAASASISKTECARCFKTSLNTTPYKYLTEFRLSKAARRLKTTDDPIGTIAAEAGFHQVSHFGKLFKEKTGSSPREYRRK